MRRKIRPPGHHDIQPSSRRLVLLAAFGEYSHLRVMVFAKGFRKSPRHPPDHRLDNLRVADIGNSIPMCRCWLYAPWADLRESLTSTILRCGPSPAEFASMIPLSDAAVDHLIQLPHLHICHPGGPLPGYSPSSLPLVFTPPTQFTL